MALFVEDGNILLLHQMTPPEPGCWDLPGERLEPSEPSLDGLRRKVYKDTGLTDFNVKRLLTVAETFFDEQEGHKLHKLDIVCDGGIP